VSSIRSRAPAASSPLVRRIMRATPGRDTAVELALRRALFKAGLRFRKDCRPEPAFRISADIVFRRKRTCVFIDGCFWHGCPRHFHPPSANQAWWVEKIDDNRSRDRRQTESLRKAGWLVIRFWEHQLSGDHIDRAADRIALAMSKRRLRRAAKSSETPARVTR
jgi:DNA mismatch endonuclease (patch repair protein)